MSGPLALVGGGEWRDGCAFDRQLLDDSGADEVLVLPTASAYEHPERLVAQAEEWFGGLGAKVRPLMVVRRPDALDEGNVAAVREARFVYLAGTSPMHLRSVLKDSPLWDALVLAWDPMVDPRGGAFTLGLGLIEGMTVVPHHDTWSEEKAHRTLQLAPAGLIVVGVDERTAVIRQAGGGWRTEGSGEVTAWRDGEELPLTALP